MLPLEFLLPTELLTSVEGEKEFVFEKRFSLKYNEPCLRFRILDPALIPQYPFSLSDITTPISEFKQLNLRFHRFFITENLMNFLTLPALDNSLALFGRGYGIQLLKWVTWLADCPIFYWGDLDADGFKILSQLRSYFPQTISVMMDIKTFETFQSFAVKDVTSTVKNLPDLPYLTVAEQFLYSYLCLHRKRLEQEHISQDFANRYLQDYFSLKERKF